ncbi:MAG: Methyltransferase domain [Anaerocolumna sp.]|jgi:SAM-dependent methyltransferase|nr:Methyltransferase domain [Anaerocolumna sp.]
MVCDLRLQVLERHGIYMVQDIFKTIENNLNNEFIDMIISNPVKKIELNKITVRQVKVKDEIIYQTCEYRNNQVFHKNVTKEELLNQARVWLDNNMRQVLLRTTHKDITMLISKKGVATVKIKENVQDKKVVKDLSHNREKEYILKEGVPVPFLVDLGVMTNEGKIIHSKYDKFKQINRFLEMIEDIIPSLNKDRELTILDFGCGKSYLTFAMYYYLKELKNYDISIIGLDLKKEVINKCNNLAGKYEYDKLKFLVGDISSYEGTGKVDMVVTLHACDTATDYALYKACLWDADVILSVPCCQHELNGQVNNKILEPMLKYGLIKERFAALATDALRAETLELMGYKTQILEFIDMEHTPKNILIRAVKKKSLNKHKGDKLLNINDNNLQKEYENLIGFLGVTPTLHNLLKEHIAPVNSKDVDLC